jgi:putative PIN family toxin of toxin-antitoxin system
MRAVIDTNVLVSAALKVRRPPALALHLVAQSGNPLKSNTTERQLFEVLNRPYFATLIAAATRDRLTKLLAAAEMVTVTERIAECRDPTDDKFLELAVNGRGDLIVSGDRHR